MPPAPERSFPVGILRSGDVAKGSCVFKYRAIKEGKEFISLDDAAEEAAKGLDELQVDSFIDQLQADQFPKQIDLDQLPKKQIAFDQLQIEANSFPTVICLQICEFNFFADESL